MDPERDKIMGDNIKSAYLPEKKVTLATCGIGHINFIGEHLQEINCRGAPLNKALEIFSYGS